MLVALEMFDRARAETRRVERSASRKQSQAFRDDRATLVSTLQSEMLGIKTRLTESETRNESLQETIVNLAHENELLKRRIYGNKTEKLRTSENQLALRVERYTSAPACLTDQQHPPPPQQLLQSRVVAGLSGHYPIKLLLGSPQKPKGDPRFRESPLVIGCPCA